VRGERSVVVAAKVIPIDPDRFPRIIRSACLKVGEREIRVALLDDWEDCGATVVFVGQPIDHLLGGPPNETYRLAHIEAVDGDGQLVSTFLVNDCIDQLVWQGGRVPGRYPFASDADRQNTEECMQLIHAFVRRVVHGALS
jgi:hypothetical protein